MTGKFEKGSGQEKSPLQKSGLWLSLHSINYTQNHIFSFDRQPVNYSIPAPMCPQSREKPKALANVVSDP